MQVGYISLHRKIQNCWFWDEKPFDRARAWIDLLLLAVHSNTKQSIDGDFVEISRGQYLTTVRRLADRWGWSKDKVSKFLSVLEKDGMITRTIVKKRTLLTIVNYGFYQGDQDKEKTVSGQLTDSERTVSGQSSDNHRTQKNNVNNENNENNVNNEKIIIGGPEVEKAFSDFKKMRTEIKHKLTDRAETRARKRLNNLSGGDDRKAILILEQSIYHSWQDVFELKGEFLEEYNSAKKDEVRKPDPEPEPEMSDEEWLKMMSEMSDEDYDKMMQGF